MFISEDFVVKDIRKDALVFLSKIFRKEIADIHDRSVVFTGEPSSALKETAAKRCMVGSRGVGMEELPEEAGRKVQSCKDFTAHCVRVCVSGESVVVSVIRCSFCTRCSANKGEIGEAVWHCFTGCLTLFCQWKQRMNVKKGEKAGTRTLKII